MKKIIWMENRENNFRGNFRPVSFKVNNSDHVFEFCAMMSYKTFKSLARKFAQHFNCKTVEVFEHLQPTMGILNRFVSETESEYKFRTEIEVQEGEKRQFIFHEPEEIFKI